MVRGFRGCAITDAALASSTSTKLARGATEAVTADTWEWAASSVTDRGAPAGEYRSREGQCVIGRADDETMLTVTRALALFLGLA
jgi:hypothetical protein